MRKAIKLKGQSLVEFALLLPLFLLLVLGLFEVGRAVFYYAVLNNAVREGTRVAIVQSDCDLRVGNNCTNGYRDANPVTCTAANATANIRTCAEVANKLFNLTELNDPARTTTTINHTNNPAGEPSVHIRIDFLYAPIVPGLNLIGNIPIRVESQMLKTPIARPLN